jgi:hypothetical protein
MVHPIWRGARGGPFAQDGGWSFTQPESEAHMRAWMTEAARGAGTIAAIGIGTPILAALFMPVFFPVAVAAGALYAWRIDER